MNIFAALLLIYFSFCNSFQACAGALDPQIILSPGDDHVTVVEGHSLEVNCSVTDSAQAEKWQMPTWKAQGKVFGIPPVKVPSYNTVTLFFKRVNRSDAGFYKCSYNTSTSVLSKGLHIQVDSPSNYGAKCGSNQFICEASSHCIPLIYRCDNQPNCEDGSDEDNCEDLCKNRFMCANGKCIDKDFVCDKYHADNCGDMSDEYCVFLLPSTAESKKDSTNTTINATIDKDDHMSWLKTTLYVVIGCTVSVVFFISVIVVAVFRFRMKRNSIQRTYQSARSRRRHSDPLNYNYQADDPFLNMAPSANYGNIIVNVNNGIQYVPGAEFSEFTAIMEAPPSYSDVEREIFDAQNIPPPDYSTIDRNPFRVNSVNVTPSSRQPRQSSVEQMASSNRRGSRDRSAAVLDSRPRTQNAAVQTLSHRSQGGQRLSRPSSGTDSLPRQPNINVQDGQILLTNHLENFRSAQVSDNEILSDRASSALLQVQNGQIMLSNPNLNVVCSDQMTNCDIGCNVIFSDVNHENNPRTATNNIQVCEGQIVLACESSPAVITASPAVNDRAAENESPSRRQIDVCEGQIVLK